MFQDFIYFFSGISSILRAHNAASLGYHFIFVSLASPKSQKLLNKLGQSRLRMGILPLKTWPTSEKVMRFSQKSHKNKPVIFLNILSLRLRLAFSSSWSFAIAAIASMVQIHPIQASYNRHIKCRNMYCRYQIYIYVFNDVFIYIFEWRIGTKSMYLFHSLCLRANKLRWCHIINKSASK